MVKSLSGDVLGGFLLAGILGRDHVQSGQSVFVHRHDVYQRHRGPLRRQGSLQRSQVVMISRGFIVAVVAITFLESDRHCPNARVPTGDLVLQWFQQPVPVGVFGHLLARADQLGAYAGILTAAGVWFWLFKASEFGAIENWSVDLTLAGRTIHTMPVATIFFASTI